MKLAVAAVSFLALAPPRSADACTEPPTCGQELCLAPVAIVQAVFVRGTDLATERTKATLRIDSLHGDAAELVVGSEVTLPAPWMFGTDHVGKTFIVYLDRDSGNMLRVSHKLEPAGYEVTNCFGAGATTADVAGTLLSPTCSEMLDFHAKPPPQVACVVNGPFACSAGGDAGAGLLLVAAVLGLVRARRRR
jgi:MYXO-CTERM domain-containing protein